MESLDYLELKEAKGATVEESLWLGLKGVKQYSGLVTVDFSGFDPILPFVKKF